MSENFQKPHSLSLDNRKKLSLTGVEDVPGFNEETVNAVTSLGTLVIRGFALHNPLCKGCCHNGIYSA